MITAPRFVATPAMLSHRVIQMRRGMFMKPVGLCALIVAFALPCVAQGQTMPQAWGSTGQYRGSVTRNGNLYDPDGRYMGQIQRNPGLPRASEGGLGRTLNEFGHAQRQTDRNQSVYGPNGQYLGQVDRKGQFYDAQGVYRGQLR